MPRPRKRETWKTHFSPDFPRYGMLISATGVYIRRTSGCIFLAIIIPQKITSFQINRSRFLLLKIIIKKFFWSIWAATAEPPTALAPVLGTVFVVITVLAMAAGYVLESSPHETGDSLVNDDGCWLTRLFSYRNETNRFLFSVEWFQSTHYYTSVDFLLKDHDGPFIRWYNELIDG